MTTFTSLNSIEMREWLNDCGGHGNNNFSFISTYKGTISIEVLNKSLNLLTKIHPSLRTTIKIIEFKPHFAELPDLSIPLKEYPYEGPNQWKLITDFEHKNRFEGEDQPLWKVSFLKGKEEGQIIFTFNHTIADGVSGAQLMNQLYQIISLIQIDKEIDIPCEEIPPPFETLLNTLSINPSSAIQSINQEKTYPKCNTGCVKLSLDKNETDQIVKFAAKNNLKVNSLLFAAFISSYLKHIPVTFTQLIALSLVNLRPYFPTPIPSSTLRVLFTGLATIITNPKENDTLFLAKLLNFDLHQQLKDKKHIFKLKTQKELLNKNLKPFEYLEHFKAPPNFIGMSNIGVLDFGKKYASTALKMHDLFFRTNIENYCSSKESAFLNVVTFQGRINLILNYIEEYSKPEEFQIVLSEMKNILTSLVETK